MKTRYEEIVNIDKIGGHSDFDMQGLMEKALAERTIDSIKDSVTRALILINFQKDLFREDLFNIPGIKKDAKNTTQFIYNNLEKISRIITSLDTHIAQQICHACWWVDANGVPPKPYTIITSSDVDNGIWIPRIASIKDNYHYLKSYEKEMGKHLCIMPYYAIAGTEGSAIEGEIAKIVYFHSIVRNSINNTITNGLDFYSQANGSINTEYRSSTLLNVQLLTAVEKYDEIYIAGESLNYGLINNVKRIAEYYKHNKAITRKITILTDCTSPLAGTVQTATAELDKLKSMYGIKLARTTEICF